MACGTRLGETAITHMSLNPPITDPNDPRVTHEDRVLASLLDIVARENGRDKPTEEWVATRIAQHRVESTCRALGLRAEEYPRLFSLIWYHTDGQDHGWCAETWKEHAEDVEKERDKLLEDRENALIALGYHPDNPAPVLAVEIVRLLNRLAEQNSKD